MILWHTTIRYLKNKNKTQNKVNIKIIWVSKGENRVKLSEYNEKVCVSADIERVN